MKLIIFTFLAIFIPYIFMLCSSSRAYTKELQEQRKREQEDEEYYDSFK